jgi:hypothetical protein
MGLFLAWFGAFSYVVGVIWLMCLAWRDEKPVPACSILWFGVILGPIYALNKYDDDKKIPLGFLVGGFLVRFIGLNLGSGVGSSPTVPR